MDFLRHARNKINIQFEQLYPKILKSLTNLGITLDKWQLIEGFFEIKMFDSIDPENNFKDLVKTVPMVVLLNRQTGELQQYALKALIDIKSSD